MNWPADGITPWDRETIDTLHWLYHRVPLLSAAQMAAELNALQGTSFTKNAIIGKCRRLGLDGTPERVLEKRREAARAAARASAALRRAARKARQEPPESFQEAAEAFDDDPPPVPPAAPTSLRRQVDIPAHPCRWPLNSPPKGSGQFLFCEQPAAPGQPYCHEHCEVAYIPRRAS